MKIPQSSGKDKNLSPCSCEGSLGVPSVICIQRASVSDLLGEPVLIGKRLRALSIEPWGGKRRHGVGSLGGRLQPLILPLLRNWTQYWADCVHVDRQCLVVTRTLHQRYQDFSERKKQHLTVVTLAGWLLQVDLGILRLTIYGMVTSDKITIIEHKKKTAQEDCTDNNNTLFSG